MLEGKECLACGICMDVCHTYAIAMRLDKSKPVEGDALTFVLLQTLHNLERPPQLKVTFPYLAQPEFCDGCGDCVKECPTNALVLAVMDTNRAMAEAIRFHVIH
jgi:NAD-dependent dihydropyrimidine dehydrogenase PreA subunit